MITAAQSLAVSALAVAAIALADLSHSKPAATHKSDPGSTKQRLDQALLSLHSSAQDNSTCRLATAKSLPEALLLAKEIREYRIARVDSFKRDWEEVHSITLDTGVEEKISFVIEARRGECYQFYITLLAV